MPIDKTANHEKIVAAAKKEFLTYGYTDASMRHIADAAGMSASGLYKHFKSKEEMFSALVEAAYQGLLDLYRCETADLEQFIEEGDFSFLENGQDAKLAVGYIYDHLDAFRLIICKSQGTKYESFIHDLAVLGEEKTLSFMDMLKKQGVKLNKFDKNELHLLTTTNISAILQVVEHDLTRKEAMHYAETLDRCFTKAWSEFFGY